MGVQDSESSRRAGGWSRGRRRWTGRREVDLWASVVIGNSVVLPEFDGESLGDADVMALRFQ